MSRNFLAAIRTEVFRKIYEKPIYPKNAFLEKAPGSRAERDPKSVLKRYFEKGIFIRPKDMPDYMK